MLLHCLLAVKSLVLLPREGEVREPLNLTLVLHRCVIVDQFCQKRGLAGTRGSDYRRQLSNFDFNILGRNDLVAPLAGDAETRVGMRVRHRHVLRSD